MSLFLVKAFLFKEVEVLFDFETYFLTYQRNLSLP